MTEKTVRLSWPQLSFQYTPKHLLIILMVVLCGILVVLLSLSRGSQNITIAQALMTLINPESSEHVFTIYHLRLPRTLIAMFAGAALAVAGLILQKVIRNPLASPDIIGVTSGASFSAVLFISTLAGSISVHWLPSAAIVGAFMASVLIYILAWQRGITPLRFVLIGLGIAATLNALTTIIVVMSPNAVRLEAYIWLTGSVYGSSWQDVSAMLPWMLILPVVLLFAAQIQALDLGDGSAEGIGVNVQRYRFILLALAAALSGCAVAFAGGVGFVGLIAPHIARFVLRGASFTSQMLVSAAIGSILLVAADLAGRTIFIPQDLPAGIFVSAIGAPFFIFLLYRNRG